MLPQDFPWHQYRDRFGKIVNECGKADIWPVLAQSLSWGYGASGTHGFGAVLVKDRFHAGGHGQYFEPEFVEKYWEPFIKRGEYVRSDFETKMPPTPWWISILGIVPLRYVLVFLLLFTPALALYLAQDRHPPGPGGGGSVDTGPSHVTEPSPSWRLSLDPIPIREMHLRCEFASPMKTSDFQKENALRIKYNLWRSHQGELSLDVTPRFFNHSPGVPYSPQEIGTILVGQAGAVAQNIPITESDITPHFEDETRMPYLLYVTFPISQAKEVSRKSDKADWPLPAVGQLHLTESTVEITGSLSDQVKSAAIMINREIMLDIPLHKQPEGGWSGKVDDNSTVLRKRGKDE